MMVVYLPLAALAGLAGFMAVLFLSPTTPENGNNVADLSGRVAIAAFVAPVVALLIGCLAGEIGAHTRLRDAGYVIGQHADGRLIIGIAPTPQPTRVRWLATPAPTGEVGP